MKKKFLCQKISLLALVITTALSSYAQTQITVTSSKENSYCNATCTVIDNAELNGNPDAIIIITSIVTSRTDINHGSKVDGSLGYPHPIAVYYINQKWTILHLDNTPIQPGIQFILKYFLQPGPDRFVYVIPANGNSEISNANPNVANSKSFLITQSLAPTLRIGSIQNNSEVKVDVDRGREYIKNMDGTLPRVGSAYNIVLSSAVNAITNPNSPTGNAGGDLADSYPSPTVVKFLGRPLSHIPPNVGQVLKWDGSMWTPANDSTCCTANNNSSAGSNWSLSANNLFNTNNGNIGIGTNTPQYKLDVNGTVRFGNATNYIQYDPSIGLEFYASTLFVPVSQHIIKHSASAEGLYAGGGKLEYRNQIGQDVFFTDWQTGNGYFSGNLGVGTTTPSVKLDVAGDIKATGMITPSDISFKKNILPLENSLQKILALDGFTYNWRADEFTDKGFDNSQQIGFIAQDVEKVLPQLVHTGTDGYKGVDYTKLIPVMVEAIKEQQKQIDELKKIVAQLLKH